MSLSSGHKRMILGQRMSKLNSRNMSSMESTIGGSSNCIAENVCLEITETVELSEDSALQVVVVGSVEGQSQEAAVEGNQSQRASIETSAGASKELHSADELGQANETDGPNLSKTAILRNIFFSQ